MLVINIGVHHKKILNHLSKHCRCNCVMFYNFRLTLSTLLTSTAFRVKVFPYIIHQVYIIWNMHAILQDNEANISVMCNHISYYKYLTLK